MEQNTQTRIADELMINNMIVAVNNPIISAEFLPEQKIKILKIIRDHIIKNIEYVENHKHSKKR